MMSEQQRTAQTEMLLRRVLAAESVLRTIGGKYNWTAQQMRDMAQSTIGVCERETIHYLAKYPDSEQVLP